MVSVPLPAAVKFHFQMLLWSHMRPFHASCHVAHGAWVVVLVLIVVVALVVDKNAWVVVLVLVVVVVVVVDNNA